MCLKNVIAAYNTFPLFYLFIRHKNTDKHFLSVTKKELPFKKAFHEMERKMPLKQV